MASCLLVSPVWASGDSELLGQGNDGNRSGPIHLIELLDEEGKKIKSEDKDAKPFSTRQTCGACHDYDQISHGWHFNAHDKEVLSGRPGEPWVLVDSKTRTQIPVSDRNWDGAFTLEQAGVSPWQYVKENYGVFLGGGYGEIEALDPGEYTRQGISGNFEINCFACHSADSHMDMSETAMQSARENYRWLATSASGKARIKGVASELDDYFDPEFDDDGVEAIYKEGIFNHEDKVFFDIAGQPDNRRCYFCHSSKNLSVDAEHEWARDEDVHLSSGLNCVDCHRNGDDHMITRGTETEGHGATLSCEGCHVGSHHADTPETGRLGAPEPPHRGIPSIHFEKLSCTACHSGPWPKEEAGQWKTARIHKTGIHGKHNLGLAQPHIYGPVLMAGDDGKIAPHKVFWPAYWATLKDEVVTPMVVADVMDAAGSILDAKVEKQDDWRPLTEEQITKALAELSSEETTAVYIAGGKLYSLDAEGKLAGADHEAGKPYAWPMGHDVRPVEQAMGVRLCKDCHTTDSTFFFAKLKVDTPVQAEAGPEFVEMIQLQGIDKIYMWCFNASFVFRPFLKVVAFAACGLIALVVLAYVLKAISAIAGACGREGA
jgi:nitrate/TMAO reductase-like tetraheme cytochrome c subunit